MVLDNDLAFLLFQLLSGENPLEESGTLVRHRYFSNIGDSKSLEVPTSTDCGVHQFSDDDDEQRNYDGNAEGEEEDVTLNGRRGGITSCRRCDEPGVIGREGH